MHVWARTPATPLICCQIFTHELTCSDWDRTQHAGSPYLGSDVSEGAASGPEVPWIALWSLLPAEARCLSNTQAKRGLIWCAQSRVNNKWFLCLYIITSPFLPSRFLVTSCMVLWLSFTTSWICWRKKKREDMGWNATLRTDYMS